jgi:hypothetical protein
MGAVEKLNTTQITTPRSTLMKFNLKGLATSMRVRMCRFIMLTNVWYTRRAFEASLDA